jgi:hypothetical protein
MNQNITILSKASAMNEVIAHGKILCEILKKHAHDFFVVVDFSRMALKVNWAT